MRKIVFSLGLILFCFNIFSQTPGDNDPTFNPTDIGYNNGDGASNGINTLAVQSDGKIIIGGAFVTYNGVLVNNIARLNADGSLDPTFNQGTGTVGFIQSSAIQSDGKIIIGGAFTSYNGTPVKGVARLNTDGTLDPAFNTGTGVNATTYAIAIQSDGKIIIGGNFYDINGVSIYSLARLNVNGSLDLTFPGMQSLVTVNSINVESDDKIIVGGLIPKKIARYNSDGSSDLLFNAGTGANSDVNTTLIQQDGKIIIGGAFNVYNGTSKNYIARLNYDGSIDATYNSGTGTNGSIFRSSMQSDGKIIIAGTFTSYNGTSVSKIARLNTDGTLDLSFNAGAGPNNTIYSLAIQSNGKIIIGGIFISYNNIGRVRFARIESNGDLDYSFNPGTGANNDITQLLIQPDDKIIISGKFTSYNGTGRFRVSRLNPNGLTDITFDPGIGANGFVNSLALQSDGKILVGGAFTSFNGTTANYLTRLNSDGSIDSGFNTGTSTNGIVYTILVQPDGKIILGGDFTNYNGTNRSRIVRVNSDGSIDLTFNPGTGTNNVVYSSAIQADGKILIGGTLTYYNGTLINRIIRLNTNGTLDGTFNVGSGANDAVYSIAVQPDNKVLIGGWFTTYSGVSAKSIARLNPNGAIDGTFNIGTGANHIIYKILIQPDGKIIAGGNFTSFNNLNRNRIIRINSNGSLDSNFSIGVGADLAVNTTELQSDGKIIIGGSFVSYNSTGRNRIARILVSCATPTISNNTSASNLNICEGNSATLSATGNGTINWFASPTSTVSLSTGTTYITPALSAGIHTYYAEANTCPVSASRTAITVTVNALPTFTISSSANAITCLNPTIGCTLTTADSFIWSGPGTIFPSVTSPTITIYTPGIYTVIVSDGLCSDTRTVAVTSNTISPVFTLAPGALSVCAGSSVSISANPTGTNSVSYLWDNSATTQSINISPTVTTVYTATVTDNTNGCYTSNSTTVTVYALPTLTIAGTNSVCLGSSTTLTVTNGGIVSFSWSNGSFVPVTNIMPLVNSIYTVNTVDINGCANSATVNVTVDNTCANVWPGDANSDGTADNLDILELGLHYTQTGAPRATVSNNWQSYFANNWTGTITNGKNVNHSDCNGDGSIDDNDTLAIYNNYGLTHTFKPMQSTTVNPQLSIVPDQPMVVKGTWGTASVYLGDATTPVNNINGIAFTVDFDNTLIEANSIYVEYQNSFIDASQNLHFRKLDFANGKIFTATTHTVTGNVSGYGKIATLHYQVLSALATDQLFNIGLSQANQSDASGAVIPLTSGTGTLMAIGASVGVKENGMNEAIFVSPNPTNTVLNISFAKLSQNTSIELYNSIGALVLTENVNDNLHIVNTAGLSNGLYFIKVLENNKITHIQKVVKQ